METNNEVMISELSSDCSCQDYNEETAEFEPMEYCYGDCYEYQQEDAKYVIGEWQKLNEIEEDDLIRINGTGIGWQSRSGYKDTNILELHKALSFDGDFRITWKLDVAEKKLTARRSSHDEPMGANFEIDFIKMLPCNVCGEPVNAEIHAEELGMCVDCSNEYFTHNDEEPIDL